MIDVIESDWEIRIGIKDGKVVQVDWSDWAKRGNMLEDMDGCDVSLHVINYLRKAIKFLK